MNNKLLIGAAAAMAGVAAFAAKDPVVMTVNGVDVPRSEFEYLYHKNIRQQVEAQPLDEYVEMFKLYKLKVADALAAGIDTTAKFQREMKQYERELAAPYLADSAYYLQLAKAQYDLMDTEVQARHIMLFKKPTRGENLALKARMDSIHQLLADGQSFEDLAARFSEDRQSAPNGGTMGYVTPGMLPYSFDMVMTATPEGTVSEVFETPVGFHIIKGGARRPASGELLASHILLRSRPGVDDPVLVAKADSLAAVAKADPSQFAELAKKYSQDPGSGSKGGSLGWFNPGQMVPEFAEGVLALADGEVSDPVKSQFGYHIIYRQDHRGRASFDELKDRLIARITNPQDERRTLIRDHQNEVLGKKYKLKTNDKLLKEMTAYVSANGLDEGFFTKYGADAMANAPVFTIGKEAYPLGTFVNLLKRGAEQPDIDQLKVFNNSLATFENVSLRETLLANLPKENADYRNLLNEYRDGTLLYEIAVQNVWDKAARDTEGLQKYFDGHRNEFSWTEPRIKGYLIKATNDSVSKLISERLPQLSSDSIVPAIRKEFGKDVQIDRVLVKSGDNALVDYIVNGSQGEAPVSPNYPVFFMYNMQLLAAPQEVDDVRGVVTTAYQDYLENEWKKELLSKYPVTVNEKELKKIK